MSKDGRVLVFNQEPNAEACRVLLPDLARRGFHGELQQYDGLSSPLWYLAHDLAIPEAEEHLRILTTMRGPSYHKGSYGRWSLSQLTIPDFVRGYCSKCLLVRSHEVWGLFREKLLWMSMLPLERESLVFQYEAARGHTVIMGLGMGFLLYNVLRKPEVTKVTVIEQDREVIEFLDIMADVRSWQGAEKLHIVEADALTWKPDQLWSPVDVLLVDIWRTFATEKRIQQIQANVEADDVSMWGQEIEYMLWRKVQPENVGIIFLDYCEAIDVPLYDPRFTHTTYEALCEEAWTLLRADPRLTQ
ncbi:MAG: hypothetical protein V3R16_09695, partial [Nitrospirales bacterium]